MTATTSVSAAPIPGFDTTNWVGADALPRDQTQSRRLHEPFLMLATTDPMTGRDIEELPGHPYHVDGNLVIYFENEETRRAYLDMPLDHPFRLIDNPTDEGEAEG